MVHDECTLNGLHLYAPENYGAVSQERLLSLFRV
jgi:hypothetical protein